MTRPEKLAEIFGDPIKALHPRAVDLFAPIGPNTRRIFFRLRKLGYPPHVSAALVGNMMQECMMKGDVNPRAVGDEGTSAGIAQWNGIRKTKYLAYAKQQNVNPDDLFAQVAFLDLEFHMQERKAYRAIMASPDVESAALAASDLFWRPSDPENKRRVFYAERVLQILGASKPSALQTCTDHLRRTVRGEKYRRQKRMRRLMSYLTQGHPF